jgi:pyruvate dehydrogenase E2 component (dihydrolipoamide acetyltransferase)
MPTDVLMPKLSDTMEEGKILKWLKQPGERVRAGDILAEVETDKANMEIEAFDEGVVSELKVAEGESAPVGAVIAVLAAEGEAKPAPGRAAQPTPAAPRPREAEAEERAPKVEPARDAQAAEPWAAGRAEASAGAPKASPLARKIAAERGIDLSRIQGTGPGGRIVERDLEQAAGARAAEAPPTPAPPKEAPERPTEKPAGPAPAAAGRREFSRMRKTVAKRMAESKREVPHFYASADLAMDEAVRLREGVLALGGDFEGVTITHLLVKACGLALRSVPELNASFDVDGVVVHERINVGVATATDDGLIVPVLHDVDRMPLARVVAQARAAVARARAGKPSGEDLSGATFTLSNLGMFPVAHFAAVVNPPQAAILAVGTIRAVPVVRDGAVVPGRMMTVTLSCDHRVIDGALAGRFLAALQRVIENPVALLA